MAKRKSKTPATEASAATVGYEAQLWQTWRLAKTNLAIRGIDGQIAHGDTRTLDSMTSTSSVKKG